MVLIDTSAWIEFFRGTGSPIARRVEDVVRAGPLTCEPVRMEVLAGARDDRHLHDLQRALAQSRMIGTEPGDYDMAAALYRHCRRRGETVRKLLDCLIAAVAIRADAAVLHADADFDVLARHTELRSEPA